MDAARRGVDLVKPLIIKTSSVYIRFWWLYSDRQNSVVTNAEEDEECMAARTDKGDTERYSRC